VECGGQCEPAAVGLGAWPGCANGAKRRAALLVEDWLILWSAWVQESALWSGCSRRKRMRKVLERKAV